MEGGIEFINTQVSVALLLHTRLVEALEDHESEAKDPRFRQLCSRFIPKALAHQRQLEDYQITLGIRSDGPTYRSACLALGLAVDLADVARGDDFAKLVCDIAMARQAEDTCKIFRQVGRTLGLPQLTSVGEGGERHHDEFVKEANVLVQELFIERARSADTSIRVAEQPVAGAASR